MPDRLLSFLKLLSRLKRDSEAYAKKIILKTKGDELSELKSLTDAKGDIHSLHKLVYRDIKDVAIREEVTRRIFLPFAKNFKLGVSRGVRTRFGRVMVSVAEPPFPFHC